MFEESAFMKLPIEPVYKLKIFTPANVESFDIIRSFAEIVRQRKMPAHWVGDPEIHAVDGACNMPSVKVMLYVDKDLLTTYNSSKEAEHRVVLVPEMEAVILKYFETPLHLVTYDRLNIEQTFSFGKVGSMGLMLKYQEAWGLGSGRRTEGERADGFKFRREHKHHFLGMDRIKGFVQFMGSELLAVLKCGHTMESIVEGLATGEIELAPKPKSRGIGTAVRTAVLGQGMQSVGI